MAHKKGAAQARNGRDSQSQRLGIKIFNGLQGSGAYSIGTEGEAFQGDRNARMERGEAGDLPPAF